MSMDKRTPILAKLAGYRNSLTGKSREKWDAFLDKEGWVEETANVDEKPSSPDPSSVAEDKPSSSVVAPEKRGREDEEWPVAKIARSTHRERLQQIMWHMEQLIAKTNDVGLELFIPHMEKA